MHINIFPTSEHKYQKHEEPRVQIAEHKSTESPTVYNPFLP